ncbi:MAG: hypothetical protein LBL55_08720 [Propionibacteriaceae bacterium]|jgi:hypothetical protein|nr:hypothetical protein [Propionibacteriaceae bacterium]
MNRSPSSAPAPEPPDSGRTEVVVPRVRRHLRWGALLGVLGLALVCFIGTATAVFVDIEGGSFGVAVTVPPPPPPLRPMPSHMGGTALAVDAQGRAVIWGERSNGISGTGKDSVNDKDAASVVALPNGRRIDLLTGGVNDGRDEITDSFVVALDTTGQVWTWGFTKKNSHLGGRTISSGPASTPGQVILPDKVVDIKTTVSTTIALTAGGDVYTWGANQNGSLGQGYNKEGATSTPRRILTGVHSIGSGYWSAWAVVAPNWTWTFYNSTGSSSQSARQSQGGLVFWGLQALVKGGGAASDGRAVGAYQSPSLIPSGNVLDSALKVGTAAGDDNVTLGVRAGSAADKGTFQQMTGSYYGSQFRLRNGAVYLWGNSDKKYYAAGTGASMIDNISAFTPQKVTLSSPIVQIADTVGVVLLLDSSGTVWLYGERENSLRYPNADGAPQASSKTGVVSPLKINGSTSYPGWVAGKTADIVGFGYTAALRHKDGTVWLVCGSYHGGDDNGNYLVRDKLYATSGLSNSDALALTQLVF